MEECSNNKQQQKEEEEEENCIEFQCIASIERIYSFISYSIFVVVRLFLLHS